MCLSIKNGGLGVMNLNAYNISLLGKWCCRL